MTDINLLNELAIFGGTPSFNEVLHVGCPNIGNRDRFILRINDMLNRSRLTNQGPYVRELESKIADLVGVNHCIAMCNGTIALEIAIRALGMSGEVIVPSMTFISTAHALQWQQINPVFCDIDAETHNINPARAEEMITSRTTGILGVHLWGRPCDVEGLVRIAQDHNLKLLFDAAHSFGCSHEGQMVGSFGDAEVFSFHATKFINSFEGGAVVTNDDNLATKIRLMKNFGFAGQDKVIYIGTNGKMSEVSAAMGLTTLESMEAFIATNYQNYKQYQRELAGVPGVKLLTYDETEKCNLQYIVLEIDETVTHITRDQLVDILHAENVLARRYFYPGCHMMEPYHSYSPHAGVLLPETNKMVQRVLTLPTGSAVGDSEISTICKILRKVIAEGYEISKKMMPFPLNKVTPHLRDAEENIYGLY